MPTTPKSKLTAKGVAGGLSHLFNEVVHRTDFFRISKPLECELDNPIHSVFDECQWRDIDPLYYEKIKPALRLATLWITDDRMLEWVYHETAGTVMAEMRNGEEIRYMALPPDMSLQDPAFRAHARALWMQKLQAIANRRTLFFHHSAYAREVGGAWGVTFYHPLQMNQYMAHPWDSDTRKYAHMFAKFANGNWVPTNHPEPQIMLSHLFPIFAASVPLDTSGIHKELKLELLYFYFFFATTICHELMHAVGYMPHFRDWNGDWGTPREVFHSPEEMDAHWVHRMNDCRPETGASWQNHTFGAPIMAKVNLLPAHPRHCDLDDPSCFVLGKSFLIFQEKFLWRLQDVLLHNGIKVPSPSGGLMVPGKDIAKWFSKEHWAPEWTWADMIRAKSESYIFDVELQNGAWAEPYTWDLDTPIRVTFDVYNTWEIEGLE